jgi:hypothetical protein
MSKTRKGAPPIGKAEALQILESALSYCLQSGLDVRVGNVTGKLVVTIGGAEIVRADGAARLALIAPTYVAQESGA